MKKPFKASLILLLFLPVLVRGQEIGVLRLRPDRPENQAEAALWGGVEEGRFRPAYKARFQWSAGGRVTGIHHGKNASWTGGLSLEQTTGMEMASSMLLEPEYYPFDLLESPRGLKSRQTVLLEGGIVREVGSEWAVGVQGYAKAVHAAKKQAVRHSDFGVDVELEPTVTYVMDEDMGFALAGILRLRTENLKVTLPGEGEAPVFLDLGMRYGDWFMDSAFSVLEPSFGVAAQYYVPEFTVKVSDVWKRGTAGSRFQYPGSTISASFERTLEGFSSLHTYGLSYSRMRDQLRQTAPGAEGFLSVSDRTDRRFGAKYVVKFLHGSVKNLSVDLEGRRWVDRAMVYGGDQAKRNLGNARIAGSFTFGPVDLDVDALAGGGLWRDRGHARNETEDTANRRTADWLALMDYHMVPRVGLGGALTYRFASPKGLYLKLDGHWDRALRLTLLGGKNRETANFTVGYRFLNK